MKPLMLIIDDDGGDDDVSLNEVDTPELTCDLLP